MPQAVAATAAFFAAPAFTVGATAVSYGLIAKTALTVGMYVYQRQQAKKAMAALGGSSNLDQGRLITVREAAAVRQIVYGQIRKGGTVAYVEVSGTNSEYYHVVIALADHEVEEIGDIYFDDVVVPLDGSGNATGTYAGYARVKKHLGADSQTVDTDLQTDVGSSAWSNNHRLRGVAYIYVRLKYSADLFPGSIPNITAVVKGRKVYDPRNATTAWSANPALCLRDYLLLAQDRGGLGADSSEIDDTAFSTAANVCDESVNLNPSGTESRYTAHGVVETSTEPGVVINGLCAATAGICPYTGGLFSPKAGAHTSSVVTITEDDIRGSIEIATRDSLRSACNGVKGTYISAKTDYQPADFPPVVNSTYTTEDGGVRIWRDIGLAFTTSSGTAQRLAKIELERSRQDITVSFRTSMKPINARVGDVIALTLARYGWTAKLFEVTSCAFYVEGTDSPEIGLQWTARETASGVWDWNNGEETVVDLAPNTTIIDPKTVPSPASLSIANATGGEVTAMPRLKVTWTLPTKQAILSGGFAEIEYKKTADSDWTPWSVLPGDKNTDYITDVAIGVEYHARVRFRNVQGVRGAYSTSGNVTAGAGENVGGAGSGGVLVDESATDAAISGGINVLLSASATTAGERKIDWSVVVKNTGSSRNVTVILKVGSTTIYTHPLVNIPGGSDGVPISGSFVYDVGSSFASFTFKLELSMTSGSDPYVTASSTLLVT